MLHKQIPEFLRENKIRGGRLAPDADEDLGGRREVGQWSVGGRRDLAERGDGVRGLAFGEEGDGDVDEVVAEALVVV